MSRPLPDRPHLDHLRRQARDLLRGLNGGRPEAAERFRSLIGRPAPAAPKLADAQHAIARQYGFASWPELKRRVEGHPDDPDGIAAMVAAIQSNDAGRLRRALADHPGLAARLDEPQEAFGFGATPLLASLHWGNRELIDALLSAGADINQRSHWWAGGFGVLDEDHGLAEYLIERGARVDAHAAARLGMREVLERLLSEAPERVHARGGDGKTPLHGASTVAIAELLLDRGADIDALDVDHESTPAQYLVRDRQDVTRALVARGARTDLLMAAALGDLGLAMRHLDRDPACVRMSVSDEWFPRRDPRSGGTIYFWTLGAHKHAHIVAREFGHEDMLALLMERSPERLQLALACELGDEESSRRMLAGRPDLARSLDANDIRKLAHAARNNNAAAVRLMLDAGWPRDARGQQNGTALHWAAWHGNLAMARALIERGAPLDLHGDDYDMAPIGWAMHGSLNSWHRGQGDHAGVVRALLDAGAAAPAVDERTEASEAVLEALRRGR